MACEPKFEPGLNFDCLKEVIKEVRTGSINVSTALKALHMAGCALAMLPSSNPVGPFGDYSDDMTQEQLCDVLEQYTLSQGVSVSSIDPAMVIMIIQLVWKIIKNLK